MARLFISYKREDRPRVKELAERLREASHTVWYDESIQVGDHWWDKICEEIEACDVFIFAISQVALRSIPCQRERRYAAELGKTFLLIQVGKLTAVPTEFATVQYGDFSRDNPRVLTTLIGAIHRASTPLPVPVDVKRPDAPIAPINEIAAVLDTQSELDFNEQSALLFRLKTLAADPETRPESVRLIKQLLAKTQFVPIQTEGRALLPKPNWSRGLLALGVVTLVIVIGGWVVFNNLNGTQPTQALIPTTAVAEIATTLAPSKTAQLTSTVRLTPSISSPTLNPTYTLTETFAPTFTRTPTNTYTSSNTPTATSTNVPTLTLTATTTLTKTATLTNTYTPSNTPTATSTNTLKPVPTATLIGLPHTLHGHTEAVRTIAWSPDGKLLASGSNDNTVILWDVETGQPIRTLKGFTDWIEDVSWSPDGKMLAIANIDKEIIVWDLALDHALYTLTGHTYYVWSVAWSPDGKTIASTSSDKTIMLWNVATRQRRLTLYGHINDVWDVSWSPDTTLLASLGCAQKVDFGCQQNDIRIWNSANGQSIRTLDYPNNINDIEWSSNSSLLASASTDKTIQLWDMSKGTLLKVLGGHADSVSNISWSPKELLLASSSCALTKENKCISGEIKIWKIETNGVGQTLYTFNGHTSYLTDLAWSPDGKRLASASDDKTIILWDVHDLQ